MTSGIPFKRNLNESDEQLSELLVNEYNCDQHDYLSAIASGVLGGIVDIFLVGIPGEGKLGVWTDDLTKNAVVSFAEKLGFDRENKINPEKSAFQYLEKKFSVPYDQIFSRQTNNLVSKLTPSNHHMRSLGHSPDILGLFFSILNQFTYTSSFVSDGKLITVRSDKEEIININGKNQRVHWEIQGHDLKTKIFCGISNWFGHLMSDVAGSSLTFKSNGKTRGRGLPVPFYSMFQFAEFGAINTDKGAMSFAEIAIKVYESGYDLRHGLAMSIPVSITELSIRLLWTIRRYFQFGWTLQKSLPNTENDGFRVLLLLGHGSLSLIDGIDAAVRSGSNPILFFQRLNLIAWTRFSLLVIREIVIRLEIPTSMHNNIKAYQEMNNALDDYLTELEQIDIELYEIETSKFNKISKNNFLTINDFVEIYACLNIDFPYEGDFNNHMSNVNGSLNFK